MSRPTTPILFKKARPRRACSVCWYLGPGSHKGGKTHNLGLKRPRTTNPIPAFPGATGPTGARGGRPGGREPGSPRAPLRPRPTPARPAQPAASGPRAPPPHLRRPSSVAVVGGREIATAASRGPHRRHFRFRRRSGVSGMLAWGRGPRPESMLGVDAAAVQRGHVESGVSGNGEDTGFPRLGHRAGSARGSDVGITVRTPAGAAVLTENFQIVVSQAGLRAGNRWARRDSLPFWRSDRGPARPL